MKKLTIVLILFSTIFLCVCTPPASTLETLAPVMTPELDTGVPLITPKITPYVTPFNLPTINSASTPTIVPTPTSVPTPEVTLTVTPKPTSVPTPAPQPTVETTSKPTPQPTQPSIPQANYIDTSKRVKVTSINVKVSGAEKEIANGIMDIVQSNPKAGQMSFIYNLKSDDPFRVAQTVYAYMHANWFSSTTNISVLDYYGLYNAKELKAVNYADNCLSWRYDSNLLGYEYYSDGTFVFIFNCLQVMDCINEHKENIANIDKLLDKVPSGDEKTVAKNIAIAILQKSTYAYNNVRVSDVFRKKKANCGGWSLCFRFACERVGLSSHYYEGKWAGSQHAWASVKFSDGSTLWYDLARSKSGYKYLGMKSASNYKPIPDTSTCWLADYPV